MSNEKRYSLIGKIALGLYCQNVRVSFSSLNSMLGDYKCSYGNNRALASGVAAAYRYYESKGTDFNAYNEAIAHSFTDQNGEFAWNK